MSCLDKLSYIAGLVDGEGCITIGQRCRGNYQLVFRVAMYDKEPLELIEETFGGSVDSSNRKDGKPQWCYTATGGKAADIITQLFPNLIVKKAEAAIAIAFQTGMTSYKGGHRVVPPEEITFREACYQQMQKLIKSHKVR